MVGGAGPPLRVKTAVPITLNPPVICETLPPATAMWWVSAPLRAGSKIPVSASLASQDPAIGESHVQGCVKIRLGSVFNQLQRTMVLEAHTDP